MEDQVQAPAEAEEGRIPVWVRGKLLNLQGKAYLPVSARIQWFREECPISAGWGIETQICEGGEEAGFVVVKAEVVRYTPDGSGRMVLAQAHKRQKREEFPRGFIEKAEMGAIGRALQLAGFGTQFTEDTEDDDILADSPVPHRQVPAGSGAQAGAGAIWEGPGQCPQCHAPAGKRHGKPCVGG